MRNHAVYCFAHSPNSTAQALRMPRRSVRKRVSAHANAAKHERRYASADQPRLKAQVKARIASSSLVVRADLLIYNDARPLSQDSRLSVFPAATLLDYHASDDDGVVDERRLRRCCARASRTWAKPVSSAPPFSFSRARSSPRAPPPLLARSPHAPPTLRSTPCLACNAAPLRFRSC